jgi:hypothetical protein
MGAIKNYLINHPEIIENQRFDEGYKYRQIEEIKEWESYEDEIIYLNTQLSNDAFNQANEDGSAKS